MAALEHELVPIELAFGETMLIPRTPIDDLIFPASGLVSLMLELPDGKRVEVGIVGSETAVGLTALLGETRASVRAVVQIPGHAYRIPVAAFAAQYEVSKGLRELVHRHAAAALLHVSINAACNAVHPVEPRAARWLLAVQDRVGETFPLTQEYMSAMIAARRPVVNSVLSGFKAAGLIRHARGWIAIADRGGLEAAACVCYRTDRERRDELLGVHADR
ncbi:Crp/Fnr family transcriptional regulator [Falsiroseomonas sp.]|uniref:Crp/Fnr family transcriptional regulator n=1 Tax=Falsiroseomonas sp. TaxID=2870721 RepID=UPI003564E66F